jgi:hypothetical protein
MKTRFAGLLGSGLALLLLLSTSGCRSKSSLIQGKWELIESDGDGVVVIGGKKQQLNKAIVSKLDAAAKAELAGMADRVFAEFGSDGKYRLTTRSLGQEFFKEGTYKVERDNLSVALGGKEAGYTIKEVTSSELVLAEGKALIKFKKAP